MMRLRLVRLGRRRRLSTAAGPIPKAYALGGASRGRAGCELRTSTGFATDVPRAAGGADEAPQPVELMLAALLGCKTATAHFVARQLWPRPRNRIERIEWRDVTAERDERGALALPIDAPPPVPAGLRLVRGVALVTPAAPRRADSGPPIAAADVAQLGSIVEERCPVAAMFAASACELEIEWRLAG